MPQANEQKLEKERIKEEKEVGFSGP